MELHGLNDLEERNPGKLMEAMKSLTQNLPHSGRNLKKLSRIP